MTLPLTNLDDRRWADLVEEARALIPFHAPQWTDHNIHDPGITLIELFAWIAEMDIYWVNRLPETRRRKFLGMVGVEQRPPQGAKTAVAFRGVGSEPISLPLGVELEGDDPSGTATRFQTVEPVTVVPGSLVALFTERPGQELIDLSDCLERSETLALFGKDPCRGEAFYLGFDFDTFSPSDREHAVVADLYFDVVGGDDHERQRLEERAIEARRACHPPQMPDICHPTKSPHHQHDPSHSGPPFLQHHSVTLVWEAHVGSGTWQRLDTSEVGDETRAFTLSGRVAVPLPTSMKPSRLEPVDRDLYYLRCRFFSGAYDAAPSVHAVLFNGVAVEQAVPAGPVNWPITANATVEGPEPQIGDRASFNIEFTSDGHISRLVFGVADAPDFCVLAYQKPEPGAEGHLCVEAVTVGSGSAAPHQVVKLSETQVAGSSFRLFTVEGGVWRRWIQRPDFDASGPMDAHFLLDPHEGVVTFGDGWHSRVVPAGVPIIARYQRTRGKAGNLNANTISRLASSPHNTAIFTGHSDQTENRLTVTGPLPARTGSGGETLSESAARAFAEVDKTQRAVTLSDHEELAKSTPGVRLARVKAWPNLHAAFPCLEAPGVITIVIVPHLPADRPAPCPGLRHAVSSYLASRRILGTRVEVVGPTYAEVAVRASVRARRGIGIGKLEQRIRTALDEFFHPLSGGPDKDGWPFGRHVYRSEVLQILDEAPGTDYVISLELIAAEGEVTCGNVCIPATGLVAAGPHQIEVLRAQP